MIPSKNIFTCLGMKQGDPLSVHLFNDVVELYVSALDQRAGCPLKGAAELMSCIAFADDIFLLA